MFTEVKNEVAICGNCKTRTTEIQLAEVHLDSLADPDRFVTHKCPVCAYTGQLKRNIQGNLVLHRD